MICNNMYIAHERSLETDVLFGLLKRTNHLRDDLRVLIMSATLNVDKFSAFFGDCPVFQIPGRNFDVDVLHQKSGNLASLRGTYLKKTIDTVGSCRNFAASGVCYVMV